MNGDDNGNIYYGAFPFEESGYYTHPTPKC